MRIPKALLKRGYLIAAVAIAVYVVQQFGTTALQGTARNEAAIAQGSAARSNSVEQAFLNEQSDLFLAAEGTVSRILSDDTRPPRHQRFVMRLPSGQTLMVAHNIDLADRIAALKVGENIRVFGEYEWNPQGGVMHWTHHDPKGRHDGGWIEYDGSRYK